MFTIKTEIWRKEDVGEIPILRVSGAIDQKNIPSLEKVVLSLYGKNQYRLIIDLKSVDSINSSGLGLLINLAHQAYEVGGGLRLIHVDDKFKMLFHLLGLGERLLILDDEKEAMGSWA